MKYVCKSNVFIEFAIKKDIRISVETPFILFKAVAFPYFK